MIWSLDFNVNPMCSVIAQCDGESVYLLEELILDDANTQLACEHFWSRVASWSPQHRPLKIEIYGDASGHQRRTCGATTDWNIIRSFFQRHIGAAVVTIKASTANPSVRDRINLVNARLRNAAGDGHLVIDKRCKELILDLEQVQWRLDASGQPLTEPDKSDRKRTHMSDALGYYIASAFPFTRKAGEQNKRLL